jgi:SPP1 gp7 family putative phage head morphogenesis protein
MLLEVNRRNKTAWSAYANEMSLALGKEIREADTGATMRALLDEQVPLITSLPLEAAQRVHEKTLEGMELGARYPERTAEIEEALSATNPAATETWVRTRARLIARTETARTASVLTEARAEAIGAEQYVWKTAGDWKVRSSHKKLNGKVFSWDDPPLSDPPDLHSHPGQIFNCRCVALPIIPGV